MANMDDIQSKIDVLTSSLKFKDEDATMALVENLSLKIDAPFLVNGWTLLHLAANEGAVVIMAMFLNSDQNPDVNVRETTNNATPLHLAAARGVADIVELLVDQNADVDARDRGNVTALMGAIRNGHVEVAKMLIENDADINAMSHYCETALISASLYNQYEIAKMLLDHDVQFMYNNDFGHMALFNAIPHTDIVRLLLDHKPRARSVFEAVQNLPECITDALLPELVQIICDFTICQETQIVTGAVVTASAYVTNIQCYSLPKLDDELARKVRLRPLIHAISLQKLEIVKMIVDKGVNINDVPIDVRVMEPELPLITAAKIGSMEIVKYLISHGADPKFFLENRVTPLCWAAFSGQTEIVKLFIEYGASPHHRENRGMSAAHYAERSGHLQLSALLNSTLTTTETVFPNSKLVNKTRLSSGNFGETYRASVEILGSSITVVCKVSKDRPGCDEWHEAVVLKKVPEHPNVLSLLGICLNFNFDGKKEQKSQIALIVPFMTGGSLQSYVHSQKEMPFNDVLWLSLDMAKGLRHLHYNNMMHRDVSLRNFLLSTDSPSTWRCLLSDFGLTRPVQELCRYLTTSRHFEYGRFYVCMTCTPASKDFTLCEHCIKVCHKHHQLGETIGRGPFYCDCHNIVTCKLQQLSFEGPMPWRWCAYETLTTLECSLKSDVYMFGITLWEILGNNGSPFKHLPQVSGPRQLMLILSYHKDKGLPIPLSFPTSCHPKFRSLIEKCCHFDPSQRPAMNQVVKELTKLIQDEHESENIDFEDKRIDRILSRWKCCECSRQNFLYSQICEFCEKVRPDFDGEFGEFRCIACSDLDKISPLELMGSSDDEVSLFNAQLQQREGTTVSVTCRTEKHSVGSEKQWDELSIVVNLPHHPKIARFFGVCVDFRHDRTESPCIVMEQCEDVIAKAQLDFIAPTLVQMLRGNNENVDQNTSFGELVKRAQKYWDPGFYPPYYGEDQEPDKKSVEPEPEQKVEQEPVEELPEKDKEEVVRTAWTAPEDVGNYLYVKSDGDAWACKSCKYETNAMTTMKCIKCGVGHIIEQNDVDEKSGQSDYMYAEAYTWKCTKCQALSTVSSGLCDNCATPKTEEDPTTEVKTEPVGVPESPDYIYLDDRDAYEYAEKTVGYTELESTQDPQADLVYKERSHDMIDSVFMYHQAHPRLLIGWLVDIAEAIVHLHKHDFLMRCCDMKLFGKKNKNENSKQCWIILSHFLYVRQLQVGETIYRDEIPTKESFCWRSLSPESLKYGIYTKQSDIWCFGNLATQLMSEAQSGMFDNCESPKEIFETLRLKKPITLQCIVDEYPEIRKLIKDCCSVVPKDRPTIEQIVEILKSVHARTPDVGEADPGKPRDANSPFFPISPEDQFETEMQLAIQQSKEEALMRMPEADRKEQLDLADYDTMDGANVDVVRPSPAGGGYEYDSDGDYYDDAEFEYDEDDLNAAFALSMEADQQAVEDDAQDAMQDVVDAAAQDAAQYTAQDTAQGATQDGTHDAVHDVVMQDTVYDAVVQDDVQYVVLDPHEQESEPDGESEV